MMDALRCRSCGGHLSRDVLGGLCARCLARLGFAANSSRAKQAEGRGRRRLGEYELLREIGRGGMGIVYEAWQPSLNRVVAVKTILQGPASNETFVRRFRFEAQAAAALSHPHIVRIHEVGEQEGQPYFSMEYIEGVSLTLVGRREGLSPALAAQYVRALAGAVEYAHKQGVLHRDLKPSNVLIDGSNQPRLLDFGLATLMELGSELTLSGQTVGSPEYMAPEQAASERSAIGPEADVYSLGAILYFLLVGRPPLEGRTLSEVLERVRRSEPIPPRRIAPNLPADLETICLKCLHKEPARRYHSAAALEEDLSRFFSKRPILARPARPWEKAWLWARRHPAPAALTLGLAGAVLFGLTGVIWQWRRAELHARGEASQRRRAEAYADEAGLSLYAADIALASQAIQQGDYGLSHRTLAGLRPKPGEKDRREFGWRYLWNLCRGDELATLTGHDWIVTCVSFSPDGRLVLSGGQDGTARVWDTVRQKPVARLDTGEGAVWSVGFSPEGAWAMTGSSRGEIRFWDVKSWKTVTTLPGQLAALSHHAPLAVVSESNPLYWESLGPVSLWDYRARRKLREFAAQGRAVAISPDDQVVAAAGAKSGVSLWESKSGVLLRTLKTQDPVWSLCFSPAGDQLVTAGWSSEPLVWNLKGRGAIEPRRLKGHKHTVWSSAFSPDGTRLATASSDQSIGLWDVRSLAEIGLLRGHQSEVWCVAYNPKGDMLASGGKDQAVKLWPPNPRLAPSDVPVAPEGPPLFSPDGRELLVCTSAGTEVWDLAGGPKLHERVEFKADGFAADGTRFLRVEAKEGLVQTGSASQTSPSVKLADRVPPDCAVATSGLSAAGNSCFALDTSGNGRVWSCETGRLLAHLHTPAPPIRTAVLSDRGDYLAVSVERENVVHLYSVLSGREVTLIGHRDFVSGLAFSADGRSLATGSMDGTIRLWETSSGRQTGSLSGHMEEATDVAFSPDGRTLASLGHGESLKLWHLPTFREIISLNMPDAGYFLRFSPDGHRLAVTTTRRSVRIFEAPAD